MGNAEKSTCRDAATLLNPKLQETTSDSSASSNNNGKHAAVVLFYKYFFPLDYPLWHSHSTDNKLQHVRRLHAHLEQVCRELELKGRILIAVEGINGTVSATSRSVLSRFIERLEALDVTAVVTTAAACGLLSPTTTTTSEREDTAAVPEFLFTGIDWKESSIADEQEIREPFPDLKISIVQEIVSSGGTVSVDDLADPALAGQHLSPRAFHKALLASQNDTNDKEVVLIDVRSTFEHDIGHFVHPGTKQPAVNPEIVTFSAFDSAFCASAAADLKSKKVLLYCTGGIRCEKAAVQLKRRGVEDVSQLEGGIHCYLQEFGNQGHFRGRNFVFDQRVTMKPSECKLVSGTCSADTVAETGDGTASTDTVVGKCVDCFAAYDTLDGSRICTVCRELVLVCEKCQGKLREYHCRRHADWKAFYFTFLDVYSLQELEQQKEGLQQVREGLLERPGKQKNARRTLLRQIDKVAAMITTMKVGNVSVNGDPNAPRRCRSCKKTSSDCSGRCWGFWPGTKQGATDLGKEKEARATRGVKRDRGVEADAVATTADES